MLNGNTRKLHALPCATPSHVAKQLVALPCAAPSHAAKQLVASLHDDAAPSDAAQQPIASLHGDVQATPSDSAQQPIASLHGDVQSAPMPRCTVTLPPCIALDAPSSPIAADKHSHPCNIFVIIKKNTKIANQSSGNSIRSTRYKTTSTIILLPTNHTR
jgi:hypothetical protein